MGTWYDQKRPEIVRAEAFEFLPQFSTYFNETPNLGYPKKNVRIFFQKGDRGLDIFHRLQTDLGMNLNNLDIVFFLD